MKKNCTNTLSRRTNRLGKPRVLILGCGDVGLRLLPSLVANFRVFAVTSQAESTSRFAALRLAGAIPIYADLDYAHTLGRLARLADIVVHLAPPHSEGVIDVRTRRLCAILPDNVRLVYISTTGVYGDCAGELVDETRPVHPSNARAKRRLTAEQSLRAWARRRSGKLTILRVPGIYAENRLPLERLKKMTPALQATDDVYTNHIHAADLAQLIKLAMVRGLANRVVNAVDDSVLKMADYFDIVADYFQVARPPRLSREELVKQVSPMLLSFMSESRRLLNHRMKVELGARLRYPTVRDFLLTLKE
ncbi:MAG: NAD-dependent epimerase/dehydratase family protein [Undibacterium sp.]|nr:NAD-dependent epimerase/dehydratase family protein [Undibacterium sp.]